MNATDTLSSTCLTDKSNWTTPIALIVEFLCEITGCATEHFIELRVINPRNGRIARGFYHPADPRLQIDISKANDLNLNVYFGVAPRTEGGKGDRAHIAGLQALYVDLDFKLFPQDRSISNLSDFPLPPSAVVVTGGGYHAYWPLSSFLRFEVESAFELARGLLRKLAIRLEADIAAAEPVRILRVPGSRNWKYSDAPVVVVERYDPDKRYSIDKFEDVLRDVRDDRSRRALEW